MKVCIFNPYLFGQQGGAEMFAARFASWLVRNNHEAFLISPERDEPVKPTYSLEKNVQVISLRLNNESLKKNRGVLKNLDIDVFVLLSFGTNALMGLLLCNETGIPLIVSERSAPASLENCLGSRINRLSVLYAADVIHLLSQKYVDTLPDYLKDRTRVITNPVPLPPRILPPDKRSKLILSVGRLNDAVKAHSILLRAFALLVPKYPDWHLAICGEGPSREFYEELVVSLNLKHKVHMPGALENLEDIYGSAAFFCMPSIHEGMPNALMEALGHGLPGVGFSSCSGVNDLIRNGENGILVAKRTHAALAETLEKLICDVQLRARLSENARQGSFAHADEKIFAQWESILREAASRRGHVRLCLERDKEEKIVENTLKTMLYTQENSGRNKDREQYQNALSILKQRVLIKNMNKASHK